MMYSHDANLENARKNEEEENKLVVDGRAEKCGEENEAPCKQLDIK